MYKYICTCLGIARPGVKSGMSRSLIGCSKISSIPSPLLWDCATHSFRFAELVLLALFCFTAGCICGSVLTAQFLSPKLRTVLSRLIVRCGLSTTINICQSSRRRPRRVGAEPIPQPLTVSSDPPPLYLLIQNKLVDLVGFSGEDRIRRAFSFGQTDCEAALLGSYQKPVDRFPLKSCFYVILTIQTETGPRS